MIDILAATKQWNPSKERAAKQYTGELLTYVSVGET